MNYSLIHFRKEFGGGEFVKQTKATCAPRQCNNLKECFLLIDILVLLTEEKKLDVEILVLDITHKYLHCLLCS